MPQITVTADRDEGTVTWRERVNASDFESKHFADQLVERIGWAVNDAHELERDAGRRPLSAEQAPDAPAVHALAERTPDAPAEHAEVEQAADAPAQTAAAAAPAQTSAAL